MAGALGVNRTDLMELTIQWRRKITRDYTNNELITFVTNTMKEKSSDKVFKVLHELSHPLKMLL